LREIWTNHLIYFDGMSLKIDSRGQLSFFVKF
jgi:hypothetical protein